MKNEVIGWGEPSIDQITGAPADYLHIAAIISQCNFLHGKVLTIVDATYSNPAQNKAVKDLVRSAFRQQMDYMVELSNPNSNERKSQQIIESTLP